MAAQHPSLDVLIVGNGVAGPVLALALQKTSKHNVTIVDAGPEDVASLGGGIGVSPNGLKALHFIGAEQVVTKQGSRYKSMSWGHADTGKDLVHETLDEAWVEKYGFPAYAIKREDLVRGLREIAKERKVNMRFNMRLQKVEEVDNKVVAHFKNGETITADVLIGCDGIHSVARQYVTGITGPASEPTFAGSSTVLGLAKLPPDVDKEFPEGVSMWIGHGSFFGCFRTDPHGGWGYFHGFPTKDPAGGEAGWDKDDHVIEHFTSLCRSKMDGWHVKLPGILLDNSYRAFPLGLYDRKPLECWHKGRVTVCGDAAHPTTPLGAQGGQMAMESAVILARLLGENEPSDQLFDQFAKLRRPRTDAVTRNAHRGINNLASEGAGAMLRDFVVWLVGGYFVQSGMMGHYKYDAGTAPLNE